MFMLLNSIKAVLFDLSILFIHNIRTYVSYTTVPHICHTFLSWPQIVSKFGLFCRVQQKSIIRLTFLEQTCWKCFLDQLGVANGQWYLAVENTTVRMQCPSRKVSSIHLTYKDGGISSIQPTGWQDNLPQQLHAQTHFFLLPSLSLIKCTPFLKIQ